MRTLEQQFQEKMTQLSLNMHSQIEQKVTRLGKLDNLLTKATPIYSSKHSPDKILTKHSVDMNIVKSYIDSLTEENESIKTQVKENETKISQAFDKCSQMLS